LGGSIVAKVSYQAIFVGIILILIILFLFRPTEIDGTHDTEMVNAASNSDDFYGAYSTGLFGSSDFAYSVYNSTCVFGKANATINSENFQGGNITSIFGLVDLDLTDSKIKEPPVKINVFCLFGSVGIKVPNGWQVKMDVRPIFGSANNEKTKSSVSGEVNKEKPDLIVTGFVAFGSIDCSYHTDS
jgi:predicted membrane protein